MDDDDVLSEVEPDSVPNEVRNWLSMTFTRPVVVARKKADENKPKFKSVAQAIRAGIMVDRLVKWLSNSREFSIEYDNKIQIVFIKNTNIECYDECQARSSPMYRYQSRAS